MDSILLEVVVQLDGSLAVAHRFSVPAERAQGLRPSRDTVAQKLPGVDEALLLDQHGFESGDRLLKPLQGGFRLTGVTHHHSEVAISAPETQAIERHRGEFVSELFLDFERLAVSRLRLRALPQVRQDVT